MRKSKPGYTAALLLCLALPRPHGAAAQHTESVPRPRKTFRDCPTCPEIIVIPAGAFTMGSSPSEKAWAATHGGNLPSVADESPQHVVSIRSFALAKYDVTRDQYAEFVRETGYPAGDGCQTSQSANGYFDGDDVNKRPDGNWKNPGFSQSGRDPVVCVSWHDARAYVDWLNRKTHRRAANTMNGPYRLPSESEWEYAARGGTTTRFWWGDDDARTDAHAWFRGNSGGHTHPVGSKDANPFGLYDMVGNVFQWTEDCYADNYSSAPSDGSAAEGSNDCRRVARGGSWFYPTWLLRSAPRERDPADYRDAVMGFRVAKSI